MTKVTIDEITYSVTVAEENINVTVADASETIQIQIASGASDIQIISTGEGNSLISSTAGVVTTLKTISAGDNITLSDDGNTITISGQPEDDLSNNTTDDLAEGSNLYYTDDRVQAKLATVSGHIIPDTDNTYDLGSEQKKWRSLYLSGGSLYIEGQKVVGSTDGTIDFTTDNDENFNFQAQGNTIFSPYENAIAPQSFSVNLPTINLGSSVNDTVVNVDGIMIVDEIHNGPLELTGTLIEQTSPNQNLEIRTNNGYLHANVTDLYVGPLTGAVKIDENSISTTDATQLTIEGFTNSADMTTAINTAESNANAYTDTREIAITTAYQTYADQAETDAITASNSYADTAIANLVDSAPATLDTLNELAAALGDDPNFATTVTNSIATKWTQDNTKISNWDTAYSWGNHADEGYLTSFTETDPTVPAHVKSITTTNISNWDTAYSWGDHSIVGYLTSYTETDPIFTGHVASSILSQDISNWNTAYGWGDHASAGYLTSYTETDPIYTASSWYTTTNNATNWDTAYSWGDHSIVGYLTDYTVTESDVTQHQAALQITESQITDLTHYTDTDARNAISLTSTNTAELSYDSATGVFSYVSPSTVTASNAVTLQVRNASGVTISKGDAVYISGHSGNKVLIAKADNDATGLYPAIGLAAGAMANNTDGEVTVYGELAGVDTSTYSVGDVLYLSSTPGALTNVRPTGSANAVQNIGKVARADSNGIIIISGSGRANDVPNLSSGEVFIGNGSGYDKRALDTDDVSEATNLYYTDARARAAISASGSLSYDSNTGVISYTQPTNVSAFTNDAGYLTSYTETDPIYTASSWYTTTNNALNWDTAYGWGDHSIVGYLTDLSAQTTSNLSEGSNLYFTDARAISAVENEATLDLTGQVTMSQDLDVSGLIKINDGFTLGSFNPYAGFGGTAMPTTVMGIGQESGWAGLTIRSRGEHDWGLGAYGIQPDAPRSLLALTSGRLSGSSDDYLDSGDKFASVLFNPYSGYRTGTEWLTPSVELEVVATENHSSSGMGAKLVIHTTENGNFAGSTDTSHANKRVEIQGTTITTSDTLKLDDDVQITGELTGNGAGTLNIGSSTKITGNATSKTTTIGDSQVSNLYDIHGFKIEAGDTAWASVTLDEHVGGNDKPAPSFSNPVVVGQVWGGTPSSQEAVPSGKRLITIAGQGSYDDGTGTIVQPSTSPIRIVGETTENQTSTSRGAKFTIETTPNGSTNRNTVLFQGNEVVINAGGGDGVIKGGTNLKLGSQLDTNNQNIINSGGDVTVDDNLKVNSTLTVDGTTNLNGNVNLGNANTDTITATGKLNTTNGFKFTVLDTATANYIAGVLGIASQGDAAYITDGDSGNPCLAVYTGSAWKRIALGSDISSS